MTNPLALAAELDAEGRHHEAVDALARATQLGDIEAMTELGKRLIVGGSAPHLPADGVRFLFDAMRAGGAEAALRFATLTALGAYTEQSWPGALGFLLLAAERGSESARGQLNTLAGRPASHGAPVEVWRRVAESIDLGSWLAPIDGATLSLRPLVRSFPDFLSDRACRWLIERARTKLKRALIYDPADGREAVNRIRTNTAAGFDLMDADLVQIAVQSRMATTVGVPIQNMEGATVLHYEVGEQFTDHFDFIDPEIPNYEDEIERRGERIVTFLVYLNDDYDGGETDFPLLGLRHKGRRGEGLFFTNALPNGKPDMRMLHAGRPPTSGEKWIMSQFIRNRTTLNKYAQHDG